MTRAPAATGLTPAQPRALVALATALALCACAPLEPASHAPVDGQTAGRSGAEDLIAANANLVVQGIAPIPKSLAEAIAPYTDLRGDAFVDWHPTRAEMLVARRPARGDTVQIFRVGAALAEPEPLTDFADPVRHASYEPTRGESIVFERSSRGDEAAQLFRLDLADRKSRRSPSPDSAMRWRRGCTVAQACSTARCRSTAPRPAAGATRSPRRSRWSIRSPPSSAAASPSCPAPPGT